MTRFKGFKNAFSNNNRIYSMEDILKMSMNEFFDRENELDSQDRVIGLPTNNELKLSPNVKFIDSYIDNNGIKTPSRWESYAPINNQIMTPTSGLKPFDKGDKKKEQQTFIYRNPYPDLEEFLRRELEKLKKMNQSVHHQDIDRVEQDTNVLNTTIDNEMSLPETGKTADINFDLAKNKDSDNTLSNLTETLAKLFQSDNKASSDTYYDESYMPKRPDLTDIIRETETQYPTLSTVKQPDINPRMFDNTLVDINQSKKILEPDINNQQEEQIKAQPQISGQLSDYIKELVGDNIDYGFIGNESTTSSQPDVPIYPENGVIKGGISRTYIPEKDKEILSQSGGYITPTKASRDFDKIDESAVQFNNNQNKDRPDAKQMLEIGIYGVDSYDDNDQFKHIQDGSADIFNEKYDLRGNKTIPLDMKGIEFSTDSDFSKRISENADFQQTVKDAIDKNGGNLPEKIELDFNKDSNLNYSIGHGTLLNAHKTDDGYIEGVVFDKYDYDKWKLKKIIKNPNTALYNTGALKLHEWDKLEYYYYFVPVRFKY